jgi:glutamate dehydrogenase
VKSVPIGAPARAALGLPDSVTRLTPPELVRAILLAPVDLLWNGGIGSYVKARGESDAEVGDKANDAVRVNGADLRVKVVGEGGNLGLTQRGRIEFARAGGKVNTDALDNSAGVDCSDHEVNIKVMLDRLVGSGVLGRQERDRLLREMTDDVAALVLADNRAQNAALGLARSRAGAKCAVHGRMVDDLVARRGLDRALEMLPEPAGFAELAVAGAGLSSPELATLFAHVKLDLKLAILASELPDLSEFAGRIADYFPPALRRRFPAELAGHPLRREIVTTLLVNEMVDAAGMSYSFRLAEELAATPVDALRAFRVTVDVFELAGLWREIAALPASLPTSVSDRLVLITRELVEASARWLLTHRPAPLAVAAEIGCFGPSVRRLAPRLPELLRGGEAGRVAAEAEALVSAGVPATLARRVVALPLAVGLLDVVEVSEQTRRARLPLAEVAQLYYALSERRSSTGTAPVRAQRPGAVL